MENKPPSESEQLQSSLSAAYEKYRVAEQPYDKNYAAYVLMEARIKADKAGCYIPSHINEVTDLNKWLELAPSFANENATPNIKDFETARGILRAAFNAQDPTDPKTRDIRRKIAYAKLLLAEKAKDRDIYHEVLDFSSISNDWGSNIPAEYKMNGKLSELLHHGDAKNYRVPAKMGHYETLQEGFSEKLRAAYGLIHEDTAPRYSEVDKAYNLARALYAFDPTGNVIGSSSGSYDAKLLVEANSTHKNEEIRIGTLRGIAEAGEKGSIAVINASMALFSYYERTGNAFKKERIENYQRFLENYYRLEATEPLQVTEKHRHVCRRINRMAPEVFAAMKKQRSSNWLQRLTTAVHLKFVYAQELFRRETAKGSPDQQIA